MSSDTTVLYRPVGQAELELVRKSGWAAFPPRFSWQPIFYPVCRTRLTRSRGVWRRRAGRGWR